MNWRLAVVGSPVAHSLSPRLHEAGLRLAGLEGSSTRVEVDLAAATTLSSLLGERFDALSVTSPLKEAALDLCDEASEAARRTRSVNSLVLREGRVLGESTDGEGFVASLRDAFGDVVRDAHAVVLGTGGAARAVVDALVHHGAASVAVHGRSEDKVATLAAAYPNVHGAALDSRPVDLVVNTIPVARRGPEAAMLEGVHPDTVAVDITYEPRRSPWRALYAASGCRTLNGLPMLAFQAALQMNWWWGVALEGAQLLKALQ